MNKNSKQYFVVESSFNGAPRVINPTVGSDYEFF